MKIKAIAAGVAGLVVVGSAGAIVYSGKMANQQIDDYVSASQLPQSPVKVEVVSRQQGLTDSSGTLRVRLDGECLGADARMPELSTLVNYSISHVPGIDGWTSHSASVELEGKAGEFVQASTGKPEVFVVESTLGFNSRWSSRFATPAIDFEKDDLSVRVTASTGELTNWDAAGAYAWKLPVVRVSSGRGDFEVLGLAVAGYIDDLELGLGKQTLAIEQISGKGARRGSGFQMDNMRVDYENSASNGKLSSVITPSVASLEAGDQRFQDLSVTMQWDGIDEQALRSINAASANQCQSKLSDAQLQQIEKAVLQLIDRGVTFRIRDLKGHQNAHHFGGSMQITLAEDSAAAAGSRPSLRDRLSASADLKVSEAMLPESFRTMGIQQGLALRSGDSLVSGFRFAGGEMHLNGQPDAFGMNDTAGMFLAMSDNALESWREQVSTGNGPLLALARAGRSHD